AHSSTSTTWNRPSAQSSSSAREDALGALSGWHRTAPRRTFLGPPVAAVDERREVGDVAHARVAALESEPDVGDHVVGFAHLAGSAELVLGDDRVLGDNVEDGGHVRAAESDQEEPVVGRFG